MKGWREYRLEQFAILVKDIYKPNGKDEQKYIGLEHIEQETLRLNSVGNSTDVISNKFLFQANDILFGKLRPYFRKVIKPKFSGICSTDIWVFRAKEGFSQDFLFYFLANWDFVNTASSGEGGTRMPRADWKFLSKTKWLLPPLPEQKAIAAVLSSLDDKIDLLHRQNKTLEAMAETLFRQWFVEPCKNGLPEGWEEKSLGDVAEIKAGGDKPKVFSEIKTSICNVPVFSNGIDNEGLYGYTDNPKISVESITISARGTIGYVCLRQEPYVPIVRLISIAPNEDLVSSKFLYLWAKSQIISGTGTTQQQLTVPDLSRSKLIIPSYDVMRIFTMYIDVFFNKLNFNKSQIRTLEKLRDLLLPKLMSGEVRVEV